MTRHTYTEDFTMDAERPIRTAEALDIDARLSAAKPRPMSGEDVAHEFRQCLIFAAVAGVVIVALLSVG